MAIEKTYIMLKPDCIKRRLIGAVISRIENKGFLIIEAKMLTLNEAKIREHYAHLTDRDFFPELVEYMTSGPVLAMILEGENVISGMRMLLGPTKIENAAAGTIRGDYAVSTTANLVHASDCAEAAENEIKRFFG